MIAPWLESLAASPWALVLMFALVVADALLVVVPGEAAVTAFGALAIAHGTPPLWAVIVVAASAALCGDALCYLVGRTVGTTRWAWMRGPRVQAAFAWAARRLDGNAAVVLFTARFIPFARLAVGVTAGATGVRAARFFPLAACAATAWAAYQALVGAVIAAIVPGGPVVVVAVSVAVAIAFGMTIDALLARRVGPQVPSASAVQSRGPSEPAG
ncbi:MAG: VTT domain-containing protein [Microbacterium sp.]|uniref:DedA family protein n=1 Tax=Microbacterium sp. TaxID=51671 RepID=UPI001AC6E0F1|nr:VTT domain-containing protein [Microbacterium sp.]MBN9178315.1 VTT domain-containing protein [Microbacterium sp.]